MNSSNLVYSSELHFVHDVDDVMSGVQEINNSSEVNDSNRLVTLGREIRLACAFLQLIAGTFGNIVSFLIMTRTAMKKTSAGVYFANIAVGDTIFLYLGLGSYIFKYFHDVAFQELHPMACKFARFTQFMSGDMSVWLLVAVTVDRFVAVVLPTKANSFCITRKARHICIGVWIAAILKNLHIFWTRGLEVYTPREGVSLTFVCGFPTYAHYRFERFVRPWIALTTLAIIPAIVILVLNICIIKALKKQSKMRREKQRPESSNQIIDRRNVRQMTRMFLAVSIEYLILVPPIYLFLIIKPYLNRQSPKFVFAQSIIYAVQYVHYSINFYLWCLSGRGFRKEVRNLLGCESQKSQRYIEMNSRTLQLSKCDRDNVGNAK